MPNQQKKVINSGANKNDKVQKYLAKSIKTAQKDLDKIESEIEMFEQINEETNN